MIEHDPDLSAPSGSVVIEMDGADSQSVFPVLQQPKSIPTVVQQQPLPALMQLMSTVIQTSAVDEDMEQKSLGTFSNLRVGVMMLSHPVTCLMNRTRSVNQY